MKRNYFLHFYLFLMTAFFYGCAHHPIKTSKQLYAYSSKQIHFIRTASKNYSTALVHYKKAKQEVQHLLKKDPSSVLTTDIKYNNKKIAGLTLKQFQALEQKLKTLAKAEQSPLACAMLVTRNVEKEKYNVLQGIATSLYKAKKRAEAEQLLKQMHLKTKKITGSNQIKANMLIRIAAVYIEWKKYHQAELILTEVKPVARLIKNDFWKKVVQRDVIEKYVDAGNYTQALNNIAYLQKQDDKDLSFSYVIQKLQKENRLQQALGILPKISSITTQISYYLQIAKQYAKMGNRDTAKSLRHRALKLTSSIKKPHQKVYALSPIASMYAEIGDNEKHDRTLLQALEIAKNIKDEKERSYSMFVVAHNYADIGEMTKAIAIINQGKGSQDISYPYSTIADIYAETGHYHKALELTKQISDKMAKDFSLDLIVTNMVKAGQLDYALNTANLIEDDKYTREKAYQLIANAHIKQGNLSKALDLSKRIKDKVTKAEVLVEIALASELSGNSKNILTDIVQEVAPMKSSFKQWFD